MAVQRRVNWLSQARVDVPDMRSVESAVSNDFDQLIQAFVTGTAQGYFVRGFNILMANAIGNASSSLQLNVDPGSILHIAASQSGTVLMVPPGTPAQVLNSATNTSVNGAFVPSAVNYVTVDYLRFIDPATSAQVYIWNPTTNNETTKNAPRAQILEYVINISTSTPAPNLLPIATVITDGSNNVLSIQDDRWLVGRLGRGGITPNPFYEYPWPQGRTENPSISNSDATDPFSGGDKAIDSLKSWMDAVMSSIQEVKGTNFWYSAGTSGSLVTLREDLANTVVTGSGNISQGIIPNSIPILVTTGNISPASDQLTSLASTAGLSNGDFVFATGIPAGTTILNIIGSTVTLSQDATLTGTGIAVTFYSPAVITAPGQINWDLPIVIDVIGSALSYTLVANPSSADISLPNDFAAYINLVRGVNITPNLIFTNGSAVVTSVGAVSWTGPLQSGDFIKLELDTDAGYYKILTVDSVSQVTLTSSFTETSTGPGGAPAQYAFGTYTHSAVPSTLRDIRISSRETVPQGGNVFWLFLREDNGGVPRVYIRLLGIELDNGEDRVVSGTVSDQLLIYTGAGVVSASAPQYVSALNPGSLPQITAITVGASSTMASNQYFLINSSGNARRYAVWVNKNGTGIQPVVPNVTNYIEWDVTTGQTSTQTATALALALNSVPMQDFSALSGVGLVTVTNTSAGTCSATVNFNVGAPFAVSTSQSGTGIGNFSIKDGDNLTLAIKELDEQIANIFNLLEGPDYDETVTIVTSGATPPTSLNGPVVATTNITLPNNTRMGNNPQFYTVGDGVLEVYLNGQYLTLGKDWSEVGAFLALSSQIEILQTLVVGDVLEFRIDSTGGGGSGSGGGIGPQGPPGPAGPAGANAAGGPVAISTKTSNYTVLTTDCFLRADCTTGAITFTLPAAATVVGRIFYLKKIDSTANAMNIQANGVELIDGLNVQSTATQDEEFAIISNGTSWDIF